MGWGDVFKAAMPTWAGSYGADDAEEYWDAANAGGTGGSDAFQEYLDLLRRQQAQQEQTAEREEERAETLSDYRRNQIADRTGYAGTVMVGDATQRSDATLAAEMEALRVAETPGRVPGSPTAGERQIITYEQAQQQEREDTAESLRILSGEQYDVEDEYRRLLQQFEDDGTDASRQAYYDFVDQYPWLGAPNI